MKTITKLLCLLAFIAITTKSYAQTIAHNYKEGICILAGKPVVTRTEGTTCPGCVDADKKNQEAKNKEDKRVKEIAVKKADEEKQKAIENLKKENEKIAAQQKKAKENVLQLGFSESKKDNPQTQVKQEKIIKKESESYLTFKIEKGDALFVDKGYKSDFVRENDRDKYGELYKFNISNEEEKINEVWEVVEIIHLGNGLYLSIGKPTDYYRKERVDTKSYTYTMFYGKKYHSNHSMEIEAFSLAENSGTVFYRQIIGGNKEACYILPNDKSLLLPKDNFSKKMATLVKSKNNEGAQILVILCVNHHSQMEDWKKDKTFGEVPRKVLLQENYKNYYYFDLTDEKWKTLIEFPTENDWNNYIK